MSLSLSFWDLREGKLNNRFQSKLKVTIHLVARVGETNNLKTICWCLAIAHHAQCTDEPDTSTRLKTQWNPSMVSTQIRYKLVNWRRQLLESTWEVGGKFVTWHQQFVIKHFDNNLPLLLCVYISRLAAHLNLQYFIYLLFRLFFFFCYSFLFASQSLENCYGR